LTLSSLTFVAPVVGYLVSKDNDETTGSFFEISGGWAAQVRWQQASGHGFPVNKVLSPEDVMSKWNNITNFACTQEGIERLIENFTNRVDETGSWKCKPNRGGTLL